jgi:predicted ATP-dependent endonuclease of OLD family
MASLIDALDSDTETLPSDARTEAGAIADAFLGSGLAANIEQLQSLANDLRELADDETESPHQKAVNVFASRRPLFLLFDSAARDLLSEYDVTDVAQKPPVALANLARLAELDLVSLHTAVTESDRGEIETIISRANGTLRDVFATSWSQSSISVHLTVSNQVLHILVSEAGSSYVTIAERSDGLRQYVALLAYVSLQETDRPPVLLVDEAETHLHYDAQADLVQMFARQRVATKVIYSTHSVGCLPEDLGTGVRIIQPIENRVSVVQNWFWESDEPGFSPLLFGIGAKTLAFLPVRYALVTEGATDIILLPTLIREATKEVYLGFQVAPGLSEASEADVGLLENGAPRTAYLVDGDDAGNRIRAKLVNAGISEQRIFALAEGSVTFVLEDLVRKSVYLKAVNEELRRSHGENYFMLDAEIPETQRPTAVKKWCEAKGIKPPNKRAVAYRVLENRVGQEASEEKGKGILEQRHHSYLESLYVKILGALSIAK